MRIAVIPMLAMVSFGGCGNPSSTGSCRLGNTCENVAGNLAEHQKDCEALKGTWSQSTCATSTLIGTCEHGETTFYYGGADGYTVDVATAACEHEFHGTWTTKK